MATGEAAMRGSGDTNDCGGGLLGIALTDISLLRSGRSNGAGASGGGTGVESRCCGSVGAFGMIVFGGSGAETVSTTTSGRT